MTAVLPPQQPSASYGTDTGIGSGDSFFDDTPTSRTRSPSPAAARRSPSPPRRKATMSGGKTRSRSRSDSYTDASYSDSFDSESETRTPTPTRAGKKKGKRASSETSRSPRKDKVGSSNSSIFITRTRRWPSSSSLTSAKTTVTKHHAGSRGPRYRPQSLQNTPRPQGQGDVTRRMLSARRVKIKDLTSQIFELQRELDDLRRENKLLKTLQHKQEKALTRFEDQESDLPQLLARHSAEVRNLKERLRHKQDSNHRSEQKIKDLREDLEKKEHQVSKLQKIVRDKNLAERDELNRKLMRTEQMLLDKEKKVTELNKHLELVQGSSTRQLNAERARHKETQDKLSSLQEEYERLQNKLKEKEKELDIRNIYSNRLKVGGSKAPSVENSPRRPKAHNKNTATDESKDDSFFLTAQLNDSLEEERRRREEDERRERERQEQEREREDREWRLRQEREHQQRERERQEREVRERELQLNQDRDRRDREVEERERMARLMKERLSQSDESQLGKDLQRAEENRRMEEQREKERKEREERERQRVEQERRAKEEKQRREREEQEQREREAAERRAREEANRLEKDIAAKEEQRKKALLLARLKAIDQGENPDEITVQQNGPVNKELKRQSSIGSRSNSGKSQKEWNFRKPDENLHNGLPSHNGKEEDDLTFGGYAPTFGTRKTTKEPAKKNVSVIQFNDEFAPKKQDAGKNKSNLMESLFGETERKPDRKQSSFGEDDIFSSSTKAKPVKDRSAYPWEKEVNVATNKKNTKLEPTSTLYGGGSAIVDEEPKFTTSKQSPFLPRRPRRENSFGNKPVINAVDSFDDEIEEVIL